MQHTCTAYRYHLLMPFEGSISHAPRARSGLQQAEPRNVKSVLHNYILKQSKNTTRNQASSGSTCRHSTKGSTNLTTTPLLSRRDRDRHTSKRHYLFTSTVSKKYGQHPTLHYTIGLRSLGCVPVPKADRDTTWKAAFGLSWKAGTAVSALCAFFYGEEG